MDSLNEATPVATNGNTPYGSVIAESAVYALRASVLLAKAQHPLPASRIATELGLPRQYLEKVLGIMARAGSVISQRGARGGFRLSQPPGEVRLSTIIAPFDDIAERPKCLLESRHCNGVEKCAAHPYWTHVATSIFEFFNTVTVGDLAGVRTHDEGTVLLACSAER